MAQDVVERSHDGVEVLEKVAVPVGLAQTKLPEVHNNPRIQHDMELWRHIRDYDKKINWNAINPGLNKETKATPEEDHCG